jgi:stress-induced morphogen
MIHVRNTDNAIGQPRQGRETARKMRYEGPMSPEQMKQRLETAFPQSHIDVRDMTGTEDHYEVFIRSKAFAGLSRMERHQKVMAAFSTELKTGEVHALTIKTEDQ